MSRSDLYELLPEVYRRRDAEQESPLRALLELVAADLDKVERNLAELYDDWFIGSSASWILVYAGELLGTVPRATRFAVTPVVDDDGRLSDFKLDAQTFRLYRVCWETEGGDRQASVPGRRGLEIEYTAHGASASSLTYENVWERVVTPIEDDQTEQTALGGPETGARTRIVQEIRFSELRPRSGSGYRGLENQLYRVEIHDGAGGGDSHGFTWSRDNGALVAVLSPPTAPCRD
ncbi:MAG: hypothetical protein QOD66_1107 [Solirubrobacteraceae bacterium]|nr:hypothetical protein [Solirubrobacteraceae bacterium]